MDGWKLLRMVRSRPNLASTPVIFLTVVTGIAGMADLKAFGRVGAKAMAYFLTFSTLALAVGLLVGNLARPGEGLNVDPAALAAGPVADYVEQAQQRNVTDFILHIIPDTAISAFTSGEILQVLFVAILFGIALTLIGERGERLLGSLRTLTAIVFRMVHILMYAAPVGAFGATVDYSGWLVGQTYQAFQRIPAKIPALLEKLWAWASVAGLFALLVLSVVWSDNPAVRVRSLWHVTRYCFSSA